MFVVNIGFFLRMMVLWAARGNIPEITFLIWLFSFSIGLMSVFFAMWFDMEYNKDLG